MYISLTDFKKRIELSLCQPQASDEDVQCFCGKALNAGVGVVCLNPVNISLAAKLLAGKDMEISANVGFPFGSHLPEVKVLETLRSVEHGATQIDMVINVGALKTKKDDVVSEDIQGVVEASQGRIVKAIIETWVLTDEEKERACRIAEKAGAGMIKTTTGVRTQYLLQVSSDPRGTTLEDIRLIREVLSPEVRIKASGGIYSLDLALDVIKAGADRLGMSQGDRIIQEFAETYGDGVEIEKL